MILYAPQSRIEAGPTLDVLIYPDTLKLCQVDLPAALQRRYKFDRVLDSTYILLVPVVRRPLDSWPLSLLESNKKHFYSALKPPAYLDLQTCS
jgi:hypothetical protein